MNGIAQLVWATITLEGYSIARVTDYPAGSTVFSNTALTLADGSHPSVTWTTTNDTADGITTTVNTQGSTNSKFTIAY